MVSQTIGHYQIVEKLGEGGMGVVYKATDTKLDRTVALKFLPDHVSAGSDELERFIQEAKAAAGLNHPNICTIHGIDEADRKHFIVMEYVDGQTLQEKKSSLSMKQALDVGIQIAEGLAAAHDRGIVHRDIKPENIMFRKDGRVQIMDFGLAKLRGASRLTKEGSTVGTAGYMSPEQVQGQETDHRSDIFSLGVILYEMLTGQPPFKGMHETAIAYEIVNVDSPPMSSIKPEIPADLDVIVLECLEKDPRERTQAASQVALDLKRYRRQSSKTRASRVMPARSAPQATGAVSASTDRKRPHLLRIGGAATVAILLIGAGYGLSYLRGPSGPAYPVIRASIDMPDGITYIDALGGNAAISPDGTKIAAVGSDSAGHQLLWTRPLDSDRTVPLAGTENASYPFWSPDGRSIGYFADGKLRTIPAGGGPVLTLADAPFGRGAAWSPAGTIVFCPALQDPNLYAVNATGGPIRRVTAFDSASLIYPRFPTFLPDGNHFVFARLATGGSNESVLYVGSLKDTQSVKILDDASTPVYASGALLFARQGILMAQAFDPTDRTFSGDPVTIQGGINVWAPRAKADYSASENGLIVFSGSAGSVATRSELAWIARDGTRRSILHTVVFTVAHISPDRSQIVFDQPNREVGGIDVWMYDIRKDVQQRLTFFSPNAAIGPIWSRDGRTIYFNGELIGKAYVFSKRADGGGEPVLLAEGGGSQVAGYYPTDVSPDGKQLLVAIASEMRSELGVLDLASGSFPTPVRPLGIPGSEAKFSPDGRWIAYETSTRRVGTGRIMVAAFSGGGGSWEIASEGRSIIWTNDRIIFFSPRDNSYVGVDVSWTGGTPVFGARRPVFRPGTAVGGTITGVSPDGASYFGIWPLSSGATKKLSLIIDWPRLMRAN